MGKAKQVAKTLSGYVVSGLSLGHSRSGAFRTARNNVVTVTRPFAAKAALLIGGSMLVAVGVAFLLSADLGLGPIDIAISGIRNQTGLTFGQASWIFSGSTVVLCLLSRARPGVGTVVFLGSIGLFVDRALQIVSTPDSMFLRGGMFLASIFIISLGISTVVSAGMGAGTFELLTARAVTLGMNRNVFRTGLEASVLAIGLLLGGSLGPGTPILVVAIGPAIAATSQAIGDLQRGRQIRINTKEPVQAAI